MKISTARWAVASFVAAIAILAVVSLPLVAVCGGDVHTFRHTFRHAFLTVAFVVVSSLLVLVVALDLFDERPRRGPFLG